MKKELQNQINQLKEQNEKMDERISTLENVVRAKSTNTMMTLATSDSICDFSYLNSIHTRDFNILNQTMGDGFVDLENLEKKSLS